MQLTVYTAQLRNISLRDPYALDITVKSGARPWAPSWNMVWGHKDGRLSDADYTKQYLRRLEESRRDFPSDWAWLLGLPEIILCCYCRPGTFCHRYILANYLVEKFGARYVGEF